MTVAAENKRKDRNRHSGQEEQRMPAKKERRSLFGALLELPQISITQMSQIELMSNREALVDGCKGVLEYNEEFIRLSLSGMTVRFNGRNLQLRGMSEEGVSITGFLQSIEFIT